MCFDKRFNIQDLTNTKIDLSPTSGNSLWYLSFFLVFEFLNILQLDPVDSTPDVSYFLFFSVPPIWDTMCNIVFFLKILKSIFIKTGTLTPRISFFEEKMGKMFKKSGVNVPVLIV